MRRVIAEPEPRLFVHHPTKTLDTPAILKGGREDQSTLDDDKKTKRSQFLATTLQSIVYSMLPARFDGWRTVTDTATRLGRVKTSAPLPGHQHP